MLIPSVLFHMYADYVPPQKPSILLHSFNWFNYMRILLQRYVVNLAWSLGRRIEAVPYALLAGRTGECTRKIPLRHW